MAPEMVDPVSQHATPRGHLALLAVKEGRAGQLDPELRADLADLGWANCIHKRWTLTATGETVLAAAIRTARLRSI